jgi:uncharacterized damage-inducible protein DinB
MRADDVQVLFDYLYWLRDRVLAAAASVSTNELTSSDVSTTRNLRATLVHELDVQWSWRERLRTGTFGPEPELNPDDYPTVESIADRWHLDELEMRQWLAGLPDEQLAAPPPGEDDPFPLWYYVMHLVSHAIQQFSDAAVLLTQAGHSPEDIGFLEFAYSSGRQQTTGQPTAN